MQLLGKNYWLSSLWRNRAHVWELQRTRGRVWGRLGLNCEYKQSSSQPGTCRMCFSLRSISQLCLTLCTPRTAACQAPLYMEFYRQGYWSGLPVPWDSFQPRDWTTISCVFCIGRQILYHWATREGQTRLCKALWPLSCSVPWFIGSGGSQLPCCKDVQTALWRSPWVRNWDLLSIALWVSHLGSGSLGPVDPADTLTLISWDILSHKHPAGPLPNSWPTETIA